MLLPWKNVLCLPASAFIILLIQLFSSFGKLNGIELPLELMHGDANDGRSMDFASRMAFAGDNGVELPPNIENNMELNAGARDFGLTGIEGNDDLEYDLPLKNAGMPKWLQMQLQPEVQQQHVKHQHSPVMQSNHVQSGKHHHDNQHARSSPAASPLKRCSIEISSKVPGICQTVGSIGNACVSGDYMDIFNAECL